MIKLLNSLYLTEKGCCIKNRKFYPVHLRQGEIDGACSIYTLMMNLLILRCVRRNELEDLYDKIKKSPEVVKLFHEFFDKHGLVRNGLYFDKLKKMINRSFGDTVCAEYYNCDKEEAKDGFKNQIKYIYDDQGRLLKEVNGTHTILYFYDGLSICSIQVDGQSYFLRRNLFQIEKIIEALKLWM